ncbi:MAG: hypothetical protein WBP45_13955 [Daejeonella sp.]
MKAFIIFLLIIVPCISYSQDVSIISSPLIVKSEYDVKEKELIITYTNPREEFEIIWVGDFYSGAVLTWNDISVSYLASPIVQEFYLVNKSLKISKFTSRYFFRSSENTDELMLSNYLYLGKNDSFKIKISITDQKLIDQIRRKKVEVRGVVSVIDLMAVTNFILANNKSMTELKKLDVYRDDFEERYFNGNYEINLNDQHWKFGRPEDKNAFKTDLPLILPETARNTIEGLIKNPSPPKSMVSEKFPLTDYWYKFSTKFIYTSEIKVK